MTKEQAKQLLPVIQAWADGKAIQYRPTHGMAGNVADKWFEPMEGYNPCFDSRTAEWRVKPEPRRWWVGWCNVHGNIRRVYDYKPDKQCDECQIVPVVEESL